VVSTADSTEVGRRVWTGQTELAPELRALGRIAAALQGDGRLAAMRITRPHPLLCMVRHDRRLVLIAPATAWERARHVLRPFADPLAQAQCALVLVGHPTRPSIEQALARGLCATLPAEPSADELYVAIHNALELVDARQRSESRGRWLNRYRYELGELVEIAR
jgi:hypothetical protein